MFADNSSQPPSSVRETIDWLLRLGRPPLPECPIEAAKAGKEPKAPCFLDAKYLKSVNWKQWQNTQPLPEILDAWFSNPKTGIGTLGGWNGKHWLGWIDIDRKNYVSGDECDRAIEVWLEQYPVMAASPRFRTPSGGYRLLVAFSREPENFKASSGFSLQPDGGQKVGELLSKSGGHTLLPPTVGVSGQPYRWERWSEYPPIVEQPENVGLYPVQKHQARKQDTPTADKIKPADTTISDFLNTQVYPILSAEVAYNWPDHDWKPDGDKLRGNCPWHESSSGTAFYVAPKDGTYAWRCSACEISGYPVQYRHRLAGGDGTPRGKDFVDIVRQLAVDVGVEMPEFKPRDPTSKVVEHPTANRQITIPEEELDLRIDDLSNQDLQPSKLTAKLNLLAKEAGLPSSEVKRIYHERLQEQELAESRPERAAEIEELLKVGTHTLKLAEELPAMYAQPLMLLAQYLNLREEVYLLALLSGLSICHRTGTELIIHRGQGFSVPLNLFAGIVSESGQRKSPVIKAIITNPLRVLQREAKAEHKTAIAKYEADLERWNEIKGEEREAEFPDGKPQAPPQQKIYFFTSTSGSESINRQVAAHPDQPLLYLKDELIGVFTQQGKYSQGRGSEKQDFLSYYDGTGSTELLADGVRSDTEIILMSIFGSVQPEVLRKFTNDCTDPDGQWARFLWVVQSLAAATLQDDAGGNVDITDLLAGLYRRVSLLPVVEYTLSRDAFKLYQKVYNRIEQLRVNCPDPGMRAVYSKMTGQLGRLVGNCHVIHELASGQDVPNQEIPLVRMKQGVRMITFFLEQVKIIRSDSAAAQGELPDIFKKIIQLSQRLGRIKAKQVQKNYDSIKLTPDQIREAFLELKAMGYGTTYGTGNKLEWEYQPRQIDANESSRQSVGETVGETVGAVGETVGAAPTTVTTSTQGFQETVGEIGAVGDFSQKTSQQEFIQECYSTSAGEAPNFSGFSPTAPTAPTVLSNQDWGSIPAVGVAPTVSPTAPTVFQKESAEGKVTLQIGDTVRLPDGQVGIVDVVYPDGLLGVEYGNGTKFAKWEPSALTVVTPDDDGNDDDEPPDGRGSGNEPVDPTPQDGNYDDGCGETVEPQESTPSVSIEVTDVAVIAAPTTAPAPETSQQMHLDLASALEPAVTPNLPPGVEWLDPGSLSNYHSQCQAIGNAPIIALDIETYQQDKPKGKAAPKALHPWLSRLRLVSLCIEPRTFLIDFGGRDDDFEATLNDHKCTIGLLRWVIQNPRQIIVGHNIHFDLRFLATQLGIRNAKNVYCTMLGAQVYYGDYGSPEGQTTKGKHEPILTGGYSLANLANHLLGITINKTEQKSDFGVDVLTDEQIAYAAQDPRVTLRVFKALVDLYNDDTKALYSPKLWDCWKLECAVIPCAIEIEMAGMPLDIEAAQQQLATIEAHKKKLLEDWVKLCPDLKYTQRDKLLNHLNQKYKLSLEKLNKGLLDKKSRENPLVQIKLKIQGLDAQANNLRGFLNSATRDGRVHTIYKTLTGFGRFSSGGGTEDLPNLQSIKAKSNPILKEFNLPDVRAVIKSTSGRTMAVIDLAGAHGRIAASETQDATAIAGNNDDTIDNHSKVAVFIAKTQGLDWTWEQIASLRKQKSEDGDKAKLFRDTAKNTYYGWLNGAGWQRIQEQITSNVGITPSERECRAAIDGCKALYPGVQKHRDELMNRLRETSVLLEDGRKIVVNKISDGFRFCMPMVPSKFKSDSLEPPYTQSLACIWSRIEATAVKRALIQIMTVREQHPEWCLEVVNYVHDEVDIEVNSEFASVAVPLVNDLIGDCFAAQLKQVSDGRETNWEKLIVYSWADK